MAEFFVFAMRYHIQVGFSLSFDTEHRFLGSTWHPFQNVEFFVKEPLLRFQVLIRSCQALKTRL